MDLVADKNWLFDKLHCNFSEFFSERDRERERDLVSSTYKKCSLCGWKEIIYEAFFPPP